MHSAGIPTIKLEKLAAVAIVIKSSAKDITCMVPTNQNLLLTENELIISDC